MVALSFTMNGYQRKSKNSYAVPGRRGRQIPYRSRQGPCLTSATVVTFALFDLDRLWMWTFCLFSHGWTRRGLRDSTTRLVFLRLRLLSCPWPFCSLNTSGKQRTSLLCPFRTVVTLCASASPFLWKSSLVHLYPQDPIAILSLEPPHRISPRTPATCFQTQASNSFLGRIE